MSQFERGIPSGMESLRLVKSSLPFDRENSMKWQKRREKKRKKKKSVRHRRVRKRKINLSSIEPVQQV